MAENEVRCFGPPGTGKTTWVADRVRDTAKHRGTDRIIACSFTKAAAAEIAGRDLPIPERQIGTLHSLAYRAIDRPTVADERLDDWNQRHPEFMMAKETKGGPEDQEAIEGFGGSSPGDEMMNQVSSLRARLVPEEMWASGVRSFWMKWCEWKSDEQVIDYTDMIDFAIQDTESAPGDPLVGFFDEVQDFTPLELKLVRHWGKKMDKVILAGDDDQCIYSFKGASPSAFLEPPVGDDQKRMLEKSYRVPRAVHGVALRWIEQLKMREPKNYEPRDEQGSVSISKWSWQDPQDLVRDAARRVDEGQSVMILASASYMLDPVKRTLRDMGLPFHNPYRRRRGDWNPLKVGGKRTSSTDRLIAFLVADPDHLGDMAHPWTGADLQAWTSILKSQGVLVRGAKQLVQGLNDRAEVSYEQICSLFADPAHLRKALEVDLPWFRDNLLASKRGAMAFPLAIASNRGAQALIERPKVTIGTIHSVKGGQADCSPGDELVLTTNHGAVPIAELDPEEHRLVSFNSDHHKIHRGGPRRPNGYSFQKVSRPYSGELLVVETPTSTTRVTPNHHFTVRWKRRAMAAYAVYLMRRGDWWRIGVTQLHQKNGQSGIRMRMNREKAEEAWILGLFDTQHDALLHETLWSNLYGVPDLTFESVPQSENHLTSADLRSIWSQLETNQSARQLLADRRLSPEFPMWTNIAGVRSRQAGLRNRWTVRAQNLLPDYMEVPADPGSGREPLWSDFSIERDYFRGEVYSLDVERWHHYVSGGLVVHNCVYLFPDLSTAAYREWALNEGSGKDAIVRLMYVGMTRARQDLILGRPSNSFCVPPELMNPL